MCGEFTINVFFKTVEINISGPVRIIVRLLEKEYKYYTHIKTYFITFDLIYFAV